MIRDRGLESLKNRDGREQSAEREEIQELERFIKEASIRAGEAITGG